MYYKSRYHLENGHVSLAIDSLSGQLLELVDLSSGENLLKNHLFCLPQPLVVFSGELLLRPGDSAAISQFPQLRPKIELTALGARVSCPALWDGEGPRSVAATYTVELAADSPELSWGLELECGPGEIVDKVRFPCLNGIYWGDTWTDDTLVYPHYCGLKVEDPVTAFASEPTQINWRWQDYAYTYRMGNMATRFQEGSYGLSGSYTGTLSMKWLDYYGDGRGLYFCSLDRELSVCTLRAETFGPKSPGMCFSLEYPLAAGPGDSWRAPEALLALHPGDWHWGAERYRQHHRSFMAASTGGQPEWFRKSPGLVAHYDFKYQNGGIVHRYGDIPRLYERCREMGLSHMLLAGWHQDGFDNGFPEYVPDSDLGDPEELRQAAEQVQKEGGHISLYVNARIINRRYRHLDSFVEANSVRRASQEAPNGEIMTEGAGSLEFAVQCIGSAGWREKLLGIADDIAQDLGIDSLYLDQLAMGEPGRCVDPTHDHGPKSPEKWNIYYAQLLRQLGEAGPVRALLVEGCSDSYGGLCAGQLVSSFVYHHSGAFPELYRYTFPEQVLIDMLYPQRNLAMRPVHVAQASREMMDRAFVTGMYFWVYDLEEDNTFYRDPVSLGYLKSLIALRRLWLERFGPGEFRDKEHIVSCPTGLRLGVYRVRDGLLIAWAGPGAQGPVVELDSAPLAAEAFGPEGELAIELDGRHITLPGGPGIMKLSLG